MCNTLDPTNEATFALLDALVAEVAAMFPDQYLHIGYGALFSTEIRTRGCHWIPRIFA
jgi:N-acetyl-beta-hexosaminidase